MGLIKSYGLVKSAGPLYSSGMMSPTDMARYSYQKLQVATPYPRRIQSSSYPRQQSSVPTQLKNIKPAQSQPAAHKQVMKPQPFKQPIRNVPNSNAKDLEESRQLIELAGKA